MPLEIRELHIKINVNDAPNTGVASSSAAVSGNNSASDPKDELLSDCVDEIMQLLNNKKER
jgi:hypothetical protein